MNDSQPLFKTVFGQQWDSLPKIIKMRYANRSFSNDVVTIQGHLDVTFSKIMKLFIPIVRLLKILVPYEGKNIPVIVNLRSVNTLPGLYFDRIFYFPGKKPYRFCSYMQHQKDNQMIEFMRFGIGWCMKCSYKNGKVLLEHHGYVWKILGKIIPIPLGVIMGRTSAEEEPVSDNAFRLLVKIDHPLFGKILEYSGMLHITSHT